MAQDLQQLKEEIRARSDIVQIIGGYTRLKQSGRNWTGLCPFHDDKKPSFSVRVVNQDYKCWSCGVHGDVFEFVMQKEGLEFLEAMELLARRAGVAFEIGADHQQRASEVEEMRELNRIAMAFYQDRLSRSREARDYLAGRGILVSSQVQFGVGYAAQEWEALVFHLQQKRADIGLAVKIGLVKQRSGQGGYYDTFRERVIFPIHDVGGQVVGFGGRAMKADEPAKYINSDASAIFDKSRTLYGLNFARKQLAAGTSPVFVEGYVDVITAHQAGFTQCIATLGTSMTEGHARMLVRYSPKVIICYDADRAGVSATLKGAAVWEAMDVQGAEVRIARLPEGEDPDSLLHKGDVARFQAALDSAIPRVEFQIELALSHHDVRTQSGREAALAEAIPIVASVRSKTQRDKIALDIAHLHPSHAINLERAVREILSDADAAALRAGGSQSPRERGYPLSEQINGGGLSERPQPPIYRPASAEKWARAEHPGGYPPSRGDSGRSRGGDRRAADRRRPEQFLTADLVGLPLSGAEKSERHLLRATLSADWRATVLTRVRADEMVTPAGAALFGRIARMPPEAHGGINVRTLLAELEAESTASEAALAPSDSPHSDSLNSDSLQNEMHSAKIAALLRELLEDSPSVLSNEPLSEAAVSDCIQRIQEHGHLRELRNLTALLESDGLQPDEQRECVIRKQQILRTLRGTRGA